MLRAFTYVIVIFLLLPIIAVVSTSFTEANYMSFPPQGFTLKWYAYALTRGEMLESLLLSLRIATITSVISTSIGTLAAFAFVRYRFPGRQLMNALFMSPLILPGVVLGIALLQFATRIGISDSPIALILGHTIITVPYALRLVSASLVGFDRSLERAAANLGASPWHTFTKVTLPLISTGMIGAAAFTFILSYDNVTLSVFLSTPKMVTLPIRIFTWVDQVATPFVSALSAMVILGTVVLIIVVERIVGIRRLYGVQ